jgi:hypothetical protein
VVRGEERWRLLRCNGCFSSVSSSFVFSIFLVFAFALLTMFSLLCSGFMAALLVFLLPNKVVVQWGAAALVEGSSSSSLFYFLSLLLFLLVVELLLTVA